MNVTILGCGTSTGVPVIHCTCTVCKSENPKNQRLRASVWIQTESKNFLIDTSTDLRQQALLAQIPRIDAVLYTHPHADHIHGIDELRSFNFFQKETIPVFGNEWTCTELKDKFPYIFNPGPIEGGGIPQLTLNQIDAKNAILDISGEKITPISVSHGSKECLGYRIRSTAYVTDCSRIPEESMNRMRNLSVLILDCLRTEPHRTHFNLDQALDTIAQLKPKKTYLTHLSHEFDYTKDSKKLPKNVYFAYDGLVISEPF